MVTDRQRGFTRRIVSAVADAEGIAESELHPPLADVVDPDAIENVFRADTGRLVFDYCGHEVQVNHTGEVVVDPE